MFQFSNFVDITLIAYLLYLLYRQFKGTAAMYIISVCLVWALLRIVISRLNLTLVNSLVDQLSEVGLIAIIVLFQPEIRRFLFLFGQKIAARVSWIGDVLKNQDNNNYQPLQIEIEILLRCITSFSKNKTGALIVLCPAGTQLTEASNGVQLDALLSEPLLKFIFHKKSLFHDGAVIISKGRIQAASCVLPVSENKALPVWAGLRHRSAVGISENNGVFVIVVSEESGNISFVHEGKLYHHLTLEDLNQRLLVHYR